MKFIVLLAVIACVAADLEYYNLQRLDMKELVEDTNELKNFVDCLLDRVVCTELYGSYKAVTVEAVQQKCKKCSPYQKHTFWLFLLGVRAKFLPDYFNFKKKYDPENKYFDDLEEELRDYAYY